MKQKRAIKLGIMQSRFLGYREMASACKSSVFDDRRKRDAKYRTDWNDSANW